MMPWIRKNRLVDSRRTSGDEAVIDACLAVLLSSACNKLPESETAKKIGAQPKQIVDKVTTDVNKAMQKEAQRLQDAEKKE